MALNNILIPSASLDLNAQKLTNVADPENAQDATTKLYVDNKFYVNTTTLNEILAPTGVLSLAG